MQKNKARNLVVSKLRARIDQNEAKLADIIRTMANADDDMLISVFLRVRDDPEHIRNAPASLLELVSQLAYQKFLEFVVEQSGEKKCQDK